MIVSKTACPSVSSSLLLPPESPMEEVDLVKDVYDPVLTRSNLIPLIPYRDDAKDTFTLKQKRKSTFDPDDVYRCVLPALQIEHTTAEERVAAIRHLLNQRYPGMMDTGSAKLTNVFHHVEGSILCFLRLPGNMLFCTILSTQIDKMGCGKNSHKVLVAINHPCL